MGRSRERLLAGRAHALRGADTPAALLSFERGGRIVEANAKARAFLRLRASDSTQRLAACRLVEDSAEFGAFLESLERSPERSLDAYPLRVRRADGSSVHCQVSAVVDHDARGQGTRYRAVLHEPCPVQRAWRAVSTLLDGVGADGTPHWQARVVKRLACRLQLSWAGLIEVDPEGNAHSLALWAGGRQQPRRTWKVRNTVWDALRSGEPAFRCWPAGAADATRCLPGVGPAAAVQGGMVAGGALGSVQTLLVVGGDAGPTGLHSLAEPLALAARLIETKTRSERLAAARDQSRAAYDTCVKHGGELIVALDDAGKVLSASPSVERLLGYQPAELRGRALLDLPILSPASVPVAESALREAWRGAALVAPVSMVLSARSGRRVVCDVVIDAQFEGERLRGFVCIARDASERVSLLARLEEVEQERRAGFENASVGILISDRDLLPARSANPCAQMILGCDVAGLQRLAWSNVVHPEDHGVYERLRERTDTEGSASAERPIRLRRANGSWVWVRVGASSLQEVGGGARGATYTVEDVDVALADRRRAERLGSIMSELPLEIIIVDAQGRVEHINRHALDACEPFCSRLLGNAVWDVEIPGHIGTALHKVRHAIETGVGSRVRIRQKSETGDARIHVVHVSPVAPGRPEGSACSLITVRDITEQVHLEEQVQVAQKLEALGTLASGIAHDFNNILAPVVGYADMGLGEVEPNSRVYQYLERIAKAGRRASKLVRQILTFGRTEKRDRRPISIGAVARETIDLLRHTMPASIEMKCDAQPGIGRVRANATQIEQVFMNLCVNAAHAMEASGGVLVVTVEATQAARLAVESTEESSPQPHVRVLVSDDGRGMSPETCKRIFEPFFTTREATGGTGLGLSVVHRIITSHGGRIRVESTPGQGTTFEILLPCHASEPVIEEAAPPACVGGSERILVLDDENVVAGVTRDALRGLGYDVVAMTKPRRALEMVRRDPARFDLVLTDLTMPDLSGLEMAEAILAVRPDLPIVLMTGNLSACHEEAPGPAGIRAIVAKPLNVREIDQVVRRCLGPLPNGLPSPEPG